MGEATAKMNICDLKKILDIPNSPDIDIEPNASKSTPKSDSMNIIQHQQLHRVRRESMEQLSLIKVVLFHCL